MGTIEKTDVELVEATRRGELEAFGHLIARYQNVVCAVGYSATGDRVLGEDVAQDTFIAAWHQLDRVRDVMRLGPWLCGIARNLGRKARKRTHREQLGDGEGDDYVAATPSPFDELARNDAERIVRDALARVPETYREVLVLYYSEDRSIRDVADALGITEPAAMQRLSRGRRYLADSVSSLVERSLQGARPRRDLAAVVLAAIAAFAIPSRVDASPVKTKGSTMLKLTLAASALAIVGTTAYLVHSHAAPSATPVVGSKPLLHYGAGAARLPVLGPTAPRHTTAARRTAADDLGLLPADADAVFGIDMARIQQSGLWQQFVAPTIANHPAIHKLTTDCGFDPLASLSSVTIGVKGTGTAAYAGTFVIHGFDKTKTMACIASHGRPENDSESMTIDGDVVLFTETSMAGGFMFIDDTTVLAVFGPAAITKAGIEKVAAGNSGLESSPQFAELFGDINSDDPFWLVIAPGSPLLSIANLGLPPEVQMHALYGSIDISGAISLQLGFRLSSPEQVDKMVADFQSLVDQHGGTGALASYFSQLDVNADGTDLIFSVSANATQLMNIAAKVVEGRTPHRESHRRSIVKPTGSASVTRDHN